MEQEAHAQNLHHRVVKQPCNAVPKAAAKLSTSEDPVTNKIQASPNSTQTGMGTGSGITHKSQNSKTRMEHTAKAMHTAKDTPQHPRLN